MDYRLYILAGTFLLAVIALIVFVATLRRARREDRLAPPRIVQHDPATLPSDGRGVDTSLEGLDIALSSEAPSAALLTPLRTGEWQPPESPAPAEGLPAVSLGERISEFIPAPAVPEPDFSKEKYESWQVNQEQLGSDFEDTAVLDLAELTDRPSPPRPPLALDIPEVWPAEQDEEFAAEIAALLPETATVERLPEPEPASEQETKREPEPEPDAAPALMPLPEFEPQILVIPTGLDAEVGAPSAEAGVAAPGFEEPLDDLDALLEPLIIALPELPTAATPAEASQYVESPAVEKPVPAQPVAEQLAVQPAAPEYAAWAPEQARTPVEPATPRPFVQVSMPGDEPRPQVRVAPEPLAVPTPEPELPPVQAAPPRPRVKVASLAGVVPEMAGSLGNEPVYVAPAGDAAPAADLVMAAPVEMWFGDSRIGVKAGSATFDRFRKYADSMLDDLKEARAQSR